MKRVLLAILLAGAAAVAATPAQAATLLPEPTGYVNDFAGVMSAEGRAALEARLVAFNASTTNEIAVVTVTNMDGDYIEHYAEQLFQQWGIGSEKNDNGVLLLVAVEERELRIEVGYGLEGALPDSTAASIIQDMVVFLSEDDWDAGITVGVDGIIAATEGEYVAQPVNTDGFDVESLFAIFFFAIVILQWAIAILSRSKSYWAGGLVGAVAGVVISSVFGWWVLGGLALVAGMALLGLGFDYAVSHAFHEAKSSGVTPPWWTGGTGGGSSSSGSFGGFGGGSSGGGGASGSF